jgi:AbrB family looped-hinge helix DNA binding protein
MPSAMVTFNGRITLPTDIRKQLGLKTGDKVEFVEIGKGQYALRPRTDAGNGASPRDGASEREEMGVGVSLNETVQ